MINSWKKSGGHLWFKIIHLMQMENLFERLPSEQSQSRPAFKRQIHEWFALKHRPFISFNFFVLNNKTWTSKHVLFQYGFTIDASSGGGHEHYSIKEDKRKDGIKSVLVTICFKENPGWLAGSESRNLNPEMTFYHRAKKIRLVIITK